MPKITNNPKEKNVNNNNQLIDRKDNNIKKKEKERERERMNLSEQININNNTNNGSKSNTNHSLPLINIKEEEDEKNKYFYNGQINNTYKPNKQNLIIKKEKIKSNNHKNKHLSFEIINLSKKFKKTRDNYSPLDGNILKNQSELDLITNRIHGNRYKIIFNLLYKASEDKDKSIIFHKKCDQAQTTLTLIETKKGYKFGGYTKRTWRGISVEKVDNEAFIFSIEKNLIYNSIKGKNAIGCFNDYGPFFSGGFKIKDNAFSKGGCTFKKGNNYEFENDYELTNGEEIFNIKEIEVYEIKVA